MVKDSNEYLAVKTAEEYLSDDQLRTLEVAQNNGVSTTKMRNLWSSVLSESYPELFIRVSKKIKFSRCKTKSIEDRKKLSEEVSRKFLSEGITVASLVREYNTNSTVINKLLAEVDDEELRLKVKEKKEARSKNKELTKYPKAVSDFVPRNYKPTKYRRSRNGYIWWAIHPEHKLYDHIDTEL